MSETGTDLFHLPARLPDPAAAPNVHHNPSDEELREFAAHDERETEYGSPSYVSEFRSRSADRTANAVDSTFTGEDHRLLEAAVEATETQELVCLDRVVGRHPEATFHCRLFVPTEYARIGLGWGKLLEEPPAGSDPDFQTVQLPDYEETAIRVCPEAGFTAVLGSDYTGEAKKSFLRLFMRRLKEDGGLGLHAGSKRVTVEDETGEMRTVGQLFMGLSATGKSTLTSHDCDLESPESAEMLQDDVCGLLESGIVAGSEGRGLYIKTDGLTEAEQPDLYRAATAPSAVLENVAVEEDGTVDFHENRYTSNGRAVVQRSELDSAAADVDLEAVDQVFFITRNPLMPPIAKLDESEAAAAFMLGESVQTSAGDPDRAGEAIRVVGTNPFIIGPEGKEGNRFRELVSALDVECFLLNTGTLGGDVDIGVTDTVTLVTEAARGTIEWTHENQSKLTVPAAVPGLDLERFDVPAIIDDYPAKIADLRAERRSYLESFPTLDPEIIDAVY